MDHIRTDIQAAIDTDARTQVEIAGAAKVHRVNLNRWLKTGKGIGPSSVARLAEVLGLDLRAIPKVKARG